MVRTEAAADGIAEPEPGKALDGTLADAGVGELDARGGQSGRPPPFSVLLPVIDSSSPEVHRDKGGLNLPLVSSNFDRSRSPANVPSHQPPLVKPGYSSGAVAVGQRSSGFSPAQSLIGDPNQAIPGLIQPLPSVVTSVAQVPGSAPAVSFAGKVADKVQPKSLKKPDVAAYGLRGLQIQRQGEVVTLSVPKSEYQTKLEEFQFALIGRLIQHKGDKPRTFADLSHELRTIWQCADCQLVPMAKGFFVVKFLTMEAKKKAKGSSFLQLSIGHVRFREWTRYFDPYKEVSSLAQVWVRIYYLPVELWTPVIIAGIGRVLGHPMRIDNASATGYVGHFARVLVELDMALPILNSMYIDDGDRSFYIEFGFESMPLFCSRCKLTGHSTDKCRRADRATSKQKITEPPAVVVKNLDKGEGPTPAWQLKVDILKPLSGHDLLDAAPFKKNDLPLAGDANRYQALDEDEEEEVEETIIADSNFEAEPLHEEENDGSPHTDKASDKEGSNVEGTLELDSGTNSGAVVEQQPVVGAEDSATQRVNSPIKEVDFDNKSISSPDDMASRIIRLEEQVNQGMQLLSEQKRGRGRPKGSVKGREPIHAIPEGCIKSRLRNAEEMGNKPMEFVVDVTNRPSMIAMNNVVHRRWSDDLDNDPDFPF